MTNAPDTNNPPSGGVVLPRTSNRGLPVNVQNMADMAPAFNLRWDSSRAAYYVDKPNIGDTAVYTAEQVAALQQQLAAAREALVKIARRANPHEDDDDADRKRNLYHIESIATGAIKAVATLQRDRQP